MSLIKFSKLAVIAVLMLCGCRPLEVTPMPVQPTDSEKCADACNHLRKLKCLEGDPIKTNIKCEANYDCEGGVCATNRKCLVTCEKFCYDIQSAGVWLDPTCVANIKSCADINSCPMRKK